MRICIFFSLGSELSFDVRNNISSQHSHDHCIGQHVRIRLENMLSVHSTLGLLFCGHPCCEQLWRKQFAVERNQQLMHHIKNSNTKMKLQLGHLYFK